MTLRQFIKAHRAEIDGVIRLVVGPDARCNDEERRVWVLNDEGLYLWARSKGVKI